MTAKIGTIRTERNRAIKGQKDMRRTNRAMRHQLEAACALLRDLLDHSQAYPSALEIDVYGGFDGAEWAKRAEEFLKGVESC